MQQYLYKATGIILATTYITSVVTVHAMLRLLLGLETDIATRQVIAGGAGLLVVTTPLWWLHWRWMRQQPAAAAAGVAPAFHTYVLTTALVALFVIFGSAGLGVAVLVRLALGILADSSLGWAQSLTAVAAMVMATGIWAVHWRYVDPHPGKTGRADWPVARG